MPTGRMYVGETLISEGFREFVDPYVRPADWLTLPDLTGLEKFAGLCAVWGDTGDYVALQCAGAYTVNWGDGSAPQDVAANTSAYHLFDYDGLVGTDSTRGYRQAIVTVVPQAGQHLTKVDLNIQHTSLGSTSRSSNWLDIAVAGTQLATMTVYGNNADHNSLEKFSLIGATALTALSFYGCIRLQSVQIDPGTTLTSMASMFRECSLLQTVPLFDTSSVTSATGCFQNCYSLREIPAFDLSSLGSWQAFFQNCSSLQYIPDLNMHPTSLFSTFRGCQSLQTVPLFDTSGVTTGNGFQEMFYGCRNLRSVPLFDTSNATTFTDMFRECNVLTEVPQFNLGKATSCATMFYNCWALTTTPAFTIGAPGANCSLNSMFYGCYSLTEIGALTVQTGRITDVQSMFYGCLALRTVPLFDTSGVATGNYKNMFYGCNSLESIPTYNMTNCTDATGMFTGCRSLRTIPALNLTNMSTTSVIDTPALTSFLATGVKITINFSNCCLDAAALNTIYTNLATVTAKTITVTGNPGVAGDDPTIATAKGWTVTG